MANTDYTQSLSNIQHSIEELSREVAGVTDELNHDMMGVDDVNGMTPNANLGTIAVSLFEINTSLKQFNRMYAMVNSDDMKHMETLLGIKGETA